MLKVYFHSKISVNEKNFIENLILNLINLIWLFLEPVDVTKPNLKDDMIRMKQLLQINQFGSSPKITIEYCKMRFYTLKRIQGIFN